MLNHKFTASKYAKIDYTKMVATAVSNYSAETPYHMHQLLKIIDKYTPGAKSAIDANAHIGGFSLVYAKTHPKCVLTSVEINPEAYNALNRNMRALGITNIAPVLSDTVVYLENLKTSKKSDFIYVDPPWGGPEYRNFQNIDLPMGRMRSREFIDLSLKIAPVVYFKVPNNYDFSLLQGLNIVKYEIRGENPKKITHDYTLIVIH